MTRAISRLGGAAAAAAPRGGPFDLEDHAAYRRWREWKLDCRPTGITALTVEIDALDRVSDAARAAITERCRRANMAVYSVRGDPGTGTRLARGLRQFAAIFGLHRLDRHLMAGDDGIAALEVGAAGAPGATEYIPYTDRPLSWHTDGYYNSASGQVRAVILHCARDAGAGGENALLDPEIAYIRLRDEDPGFIDALMRPDVMTIPANMQGGREIRPARIGPVFSLDPRSGALHMRYSARAKNIQWKDDAAVRRALKFLTALLDGGEAGILRHRLAPGQGLIGNNVLHNRTGFSDVRGTSRLIYRARFCDRIAGTSPPTD